MLSRAMMTWNAWSLVCVGIFITGCTPAIIGSNPRQVIVRSPMLDAKEAQMLAQQECEKHQRYARLTIKGDYTERIYIFDCVE